VDYWFWNELRRCPRSQIGYDRIRLAGSGTGAVHRHRSRLEASGLVSVRRSGNQNLYQAHPDSPIDRELTGLVVKTVGIADPIRRALA
jgi:hypothetical protein